ncbi:ribosome-binding protein aMBF1 (putative translation factor) [Mitsuaria sp. BK037]|nr:ribosome-binding protein aMBF1 (putative translation factor) [Mitsuaria sp. BK037]
MQILDFRPVLQGMVDTLNESGVRQRLQNESMQPKARVMLETASFPEDVGLILKARREARGMSISALARDAFRVREVIYRLEAGQESSVSSLMCVTRALGLRIRFEKAGMPTIEELAERFARDDDD